MMIHSPRSMFAERRRVRRSCWWNRVSIEGDCPQLALPPATPPLDGRSPYGLPTHGIAADVARIPSPLLTHRQMLSRLA